MNYDPWKLWARSGRLNVLSMCRSEQAWVNGRLHSGCAPTDLMDVERDPRTPDVPNLLRAFPDGQQVAVRDERLVGYALSICVDTGRRPQAAQLAEALNEGGDLAARHTSTGDTLWGLRLCATVPDYHTEVIECLVTFSRLALVRELGLRRLISPVRLADYAKWSEMLTPQAYVQQVDAGALVDRALTPLLARGARVLPSVMVDGTSSTPLLIVLTRWENPVR